MRTLTHPIHLLLVLLIGLTFSLAATAAPRYGSQLCQTQGYQCVKVPSGATWETLFPDPQQRALVMRVNRMNVEVSPGMVIAVPQDLNQDYLAYAPFPSRIEPTGNRVVLVDPDHYAWGAFESDGTLVHWGPMSGGKGWCSDLHSSCRTAVGKFTVYREGGAYCKSTKFPIPEGGAPMPYCMFFHGGYAIHASDQVPGYHASHGCVRVFYEDAAWLSQEFVDPGTTVIILPYHHDKFFNPSSL